MEEQPASFIFWHYVALVQRWLWFLVLTTVLATVGTYVVSKRQTPIYEASTRLLISEAPGVRNAVDYSTLQTAQTLASTYAQLIVDRVVLDKVAQRLGGTYTADQLRGQIQVNPVRDTQLLEIRVQDANPQNAATIDNAVASVFIDQVQSMQASRYQASKDSLTAQLAEIDGQIQQTQKSLSALVADTGNQTQRDRLEAELTQYRQSYANVLQTFEQIRSTEIQSSSNVDQLGIAIPPQGPIFPRVLENTFAAVILGFVIGFALIILRETLDETLKNINEIPEKWGLPVLGFIPFFPGTPENELPMASTQPRSPAAERFRALRSNIQFASVDRPLHTILITSPSPGDGKTVVASNLSAILAQGGKQVLLIDADMRRPSQHHRFDLLNTNGLSNLFIQPTLHLDGAVQPTQVEGLSLISTGKTPPNPAELLGSDRMHDIIHMVKGQADIVVIDTPPVTSVTDAAILAPFVDGVLLVVQPGHTKVATCRQAIEELRRSGANILGVVVNAVRAADARYYYSGYSHYYHYYADDNRRRSRNPLVRLWASPPFASHRPSNETAKAVVSHETAYQA